MSLTQVSTGMIADSAVTPGKLSTGAPSWDSAGKITTLGTINVPDEYYTGAGVGAGASGSWQYKSGASGFIVGNTNGLERFRIDASGRVTMPYQPAFHAFWSTGGASGPVVGRFNSVTTNIGGCYNASTYQFTAPVAGTYFFASDVIGSTGSTLSISLRRNGTIWTGQSWQGAPAGSEPGASIAGLITLSAGDYVDVYIGTASGSYGNGYGNFCGYLLG